MQYWANAQLERVPTKYFLDKGCGQSDITFHAGSFHMALKDCGIENYNVVTYSSILPKKCTEIQGIDRPKLRRGAVMDTIMARFDGHKGDNIAAGIVRGDLIKRTNGTYDGSIVCEIGGKLSQAQLDKRLRKAVQELYENGYSEEYELQNVRTDIQACKVEKAFGTVLVVIAFVEHENIFAPPKLEAANFLGSQVPYKSARYVVLPISYDGTATYNRGTAQGPSAILDASTHLETYDIETDSQPHKAGIHTLPSKTLEDDPDQMVALVKKETTKLLQDKKFPLIFAGGHGVSIGAFQAIGEFYKEFTILQLDAHSDLRPSYDGTPLSEACVMRRGLEVTDKIVQVGIRSISKGETNVLDYDKLFLAEDIKKSGNVWLDDVLAECSDNVYITFDVDALDPSVVHAGTPEPNGLYYEHVLALFKKVVKERNVIGFDVNNLVPVPGMNGPEFTIAKLIFQFIAYREKFGR